MAGRTLLIATRSAGKRRELHPLFTAAGFEPIDPTEAGIPESPDEEGIERYDSFRENALAKADWFHRASGGLPTVADDSGLEVMALGGRPGVRSKRWSGRSDLTGQALDDANNRMLLDALASHGERSARYVCAAAFVDRRGSFVAIGETDGRILLAPRGDDGFGYDPYFESTELGRTFGELSREAKERVSHRGRAMRALLEWMQHRDG